MSFNQNVFDTIIRDGSHDESSNGEVFTRRWIVELILDLSGYTADKDLASKTAVEPACGAGAFLVPMVERLATSCLLHGRSIKNAGEAIRAFDLLQTNVEVSREAVDQALTGYCDDPSVRLMLTQAWVSQADFLLQSGEISGVDYVLGNPPYLRLEDVPVYRSVMYRNICSTMRGRSDIYIGFIESALRMLTPAGVLGFIIPDRWMYNQYGARLREFVASGFAVEAIVSMHDVDAFENSVSAYPAVTVIRKAEQRQSFVATAEKSFDETQVKPFKKWVASEKSSLELNSVRAARLPGWFDGSSSWPAGDPVNLKLVSELERKFPPLQPEDGATRVGIGLATGIDSVYLAKDAELVEHDRLLPMLMTKDTKLGSPAWSGTYLVNPWKSGKLVDLDEFPKLKHYFESNSDSIRKRHVARVNPKKWYKTIDRVEPGLQERNKLLIPDLKSHIHPVLDAGKYYPHHGLYFVVSDTWDLEVLGGILLSDIAELFVVTYCVKMRGGCYRFQAQYLRRIRVPPMESISGHDRKALKSIFRRRDRAAATSLAAELYGVSGRFKPRAVRETA